MPGRPILCATDRRDLRLRYRRDSAHDADRYARNCCGSCPEDSAGCHETIGGSVAGSFRRSGHFSCGYRPRDAVEKTARQQFLEKHFHKRKNWLFADTVGSARASANLYPLIETCEANGVDTYRHVVALLTAPACKDGR